MIEYLPGWQEAFLWVLIVAFIVAFVLAFSMGANDCANSYGTAVGSGVLKLWWAYCLATVFETTGAALLGYKVTNTIRKSIVNVDIYTVHSQLTSNSTYHLVNDCGLFSAINGSDSSGLPCTSYTSGEYLLGALGSLIGCALWLLLATVLRMPVSTTHSIVGATVGFSVVLRGPMGINWMQIVNIVVSWVASPLLAGTISTIIYVFIKHLALNKKDPLEASLNMLPFLFWFGIGVNMFSITYDGSKYLKLDHLSWWMVLVLSAGTGGVVALVAYLLKNRFRNYIHSNHSIDVLVPIVMDLNAHIGKAIFKKKSKSRQSLAFVVTNSKHDTPKPKDYDPEEAVVLTGIQTPNYNISANQTPLEPATPANWATNNNRTPNALKPTASRLLQLNGKVKETKENGQTKEEANGKAAEAGAGAINGNGFTLLDVPGETQVVDPKSLRDRLKALKDPVEEHPHASKVFAVLQVMSACFLSFSHGSNDTANAVGPLVAIFLVYQNGNAMAEGDDVIMESLIIFGALSMVFGLWMLGHKVIETVGTEITAITPASGFSMELGTSFTVLLASKIGIPVSTTHCLVGGVVCVGWFKTRKGVSWKVFRNIALTWVVTLPTTALISAAAAYGLQYIL